MSDNDYDPLTSPAQQIQAMTDQSSTNTPPLMFGQHGHGSQCHRWN
jgi:hypothetical protein